MAPHVAGIVAAEDNMLGTIGIAPKATLIGVKVLHGGSGAFGWVIAGILYAPTSST
jgi:lantibiotic leader peptide-processing serine protease